MCEDFKDNQDDVYVKCGMEDRYLIGIKPDTKKRICSCCLFYSQPTLVTCRHCRGFDKFECKYDEFGMYTTIVSTNTGMIMIAVNKEENDER